MGANEWQNYENGFSRRKLLPNKCFRIKVVEHLKWNLKHKNLYSKLHFHSILSPSRKLEAFERKTQRGGGWCRMKKTKPRRRSESSEKSYLSSYIQGKEFSNKRINNARVLSANLFTLAPKFDPFFAPRWLWSGSSVNIAWQVGINISSCWVISTE